ncbi:inheritance of peroxisomes protein 1-domain-containing protein [Aspergillus avenaceus]|uniref:Inheritance of peroxisomes protein 1 n=1 Tax=Aspergillus avenaceus TaxID=36643 RepID=A0A5N6U0W7_ASPAV|nr:inheritance of peroxisomes protein 1-domain-containing protein [Aspergillus avenaceus]
MTDSFDAPLPQIQSSIRRSTTLPTKLILRSTRSVESLRPSQNDVFFHPAAKVVHFAPRALAPIPSSTSPADFDYPVDTVETLPWRSPTERTVAIAPLRLENVHGLTVFLKCGSVVHAILKNSQCWCVDGESTFVLRIRPLTYYRIELPNESEDDKESVMAMKEALPRILRYEVTPCPFKRGFTVEIPEEAKVPRRKKAWRPKGRRESAPVQSVFLKERSLSREEMPTTEYLSTGEDTDGNLTDDSCFTAKGSNSTTLETIPDDNEPPASSDTPENTEVPRQSITETQQSFQTLLARFEDAPEPAPQPDTTLSSAESVHSAAPPSYSPTESNTNPTLLLTSNDRTDRPATDSHERRRPTEDVAFETVEYSEEKPLPEVKCTDCCSPRPQASPRTSFSEFRPMPGALPDDQMSVISYAGTSRSTDSNPNLSSMSMEFRRRSRASRERELSPMPSQSALALPSQSEKHNAASLIQKTCTVVLIPPIQLFVVLIHIAARIVLGPALTTATRNLDRRFEYHVTNPGDAVDDFDLPLAPDCPRKQSTSPEASAWDLD